MTKIHTIRFYDRALLKQTRIQAAMDGMSFREFIETALRFYLALRQPGGPPMPAAPTSNPAIGGHDGE